MLLRNFIMHSTLNRIAASTIFSVTSTTSRMLTSLEIRFDSAREREKEAADRICSFTKKWRQEAFTVLEQSTSTPRKVQYTQWRSYAGVHHMNTHIAEFCTRLHYEAYIRMFPRIQWTCVTRRGWSFLTLGHSYRVRVCFVLKNFSLLVEDKKHFQKVINKSHYTNSCSRTPTINSGQFQIIWFKFSRGIVPLLHFDRF